MLPRGCRLVLSVVLCLGVLLGSRDQLVSASQPATTESTGPGASEPVTGLRLGNATPPPPASVPHTSEQVTVKRGDQTLTVPRIKTVRAANGLDAVADRIIVGYKGQIGAADIQDVHQAARRRGAGNARGLEFIGTAAQAVDVTGAASLEAAIRAYQADPRVSFAQPDYIVRPAVTPVDRSTPASPRSGAQDVHPALVPNDPYFSSQWDFNTISAPAAWDVTQGSPYVHVAVLDCGIYAAGSATWGPGHPDLNGKVDAGADFSDSPTLDDYCNHGTHVAGTIAANTNNGIGVAGVGYNVHLANVKVLDDYGQGTDSWVANGIYWASNVGVQVINMSLGAPQPCTPVMQQAVSYAWSHNVVVVAAAGNNSSNGYTDPASCANVVSVAATDSSDNIAYFSEWGSWVTVAAPGVNILSTSYTGDYESLSGTSMAAPHVSGLAALLRSEPWVPDNATAVQRITAQADPIYGTGYYWQSGRINAFSSALHFPNDPVVAVDSPAPGQTVSGITSLAGWAIDRNASAGTGVDAINVYLDGPPGVGSFVGAGQYGASRPDVGGYFGSQFTSSGWTFNWNTAGVSNGAHTLYVYAHSAVTNAWHQPATRSLQVVNGVLIAVDSPAPGAQVDWTVPVSGWSVDTRASSGPGVDFVNVYLDGPAGVGSYLGPAQYGNARPDVASYFQNSQFTNSGWAFNWRTEGLANGPHTLYIYAHSAVDNGWQVDARAATVVNGPALAIDSPPPGGSVSGIAQVSGWAIDGRASGGTGVDFVNLYLDGPPGAGTYLGSAQYGNSRPDVAAYFGSAQFTNSGWAFNWNTVLIANGSHTLYVYAHSTVNGGWTLATRAISVANPATLARGARQGASR